MKKAKPMPPSNMSIQTGSDRPSMKQDDHPEHNMPEPEHDGAVLSDMVMRGRSIMDKDRQDSTREAFKTGGYDETGTYKGSK